MRELTIAIDGPASSGKGTVARRVAETLGYAYVDTGATAERTFVQDIGCGSGGAAGALVLLGLLGGRRRAAR